jgi:hypothetical protein
MVLLMGFTFWPALPAAHGATVEVVHHRLDTGVVFVWKNSAGEWQQDWAPGSSISYEATYTLPKEALAVGASPFRPSASPGESGYFDFSDSVRYHWNHQAAWDRDSYLRIYYDYGVTGLTASPATPYDSGSGTIGIHLAMTLQSPGGTTYDVKEQLAFGQEGKEAILQLLGTPSPEIIQAMNLMDPVSENYNPQVEGYLYFIPLVFTYTLVQEEQSEEPPPEEPEPIITGEAILSLPEETFEGHPAEAWDQSHFTVDGEGYTAYRMYQEGLASNSFLPGGAATVHRKDSTTADILFPQRGTYPVTLKITGEGGQIWTDTKSIEVKATPYIMAQLGGIQKENRKQMVYISVATHPSYSLTELWVEVYRKSNGEVVRLVHRIEGGENELENSESIKTRPIEQVQQDSYYLRVQLPFLTKNTGEEEFQYRVYARDSRGESHEVFHDFMVAPDLPPEGRLRLPTEFLRKAGTNQGEITVEDLSITDGDQLERSWKVHLFDGAGNSQGTGETDGALLPGYEDYSFGTGKKIGFFKDGVGQVSIRLELKDRWVEETLPEYITAADYKESMVEGVSHVVNIAPQIRGEPLSFRIAKLLLIAANKEEKQQLLQNQNYLNRLLLEKELDGQVQILSLPPNITDSGIRGYYDGAVAALPFGYRGGETFLESKWFSVDEENFYTINGTWATGTNDYWPEMPYIITSLQGETGEVNWTFSITEDVLPMAPGYGDSFAHDNQQRYLFFRYGGKTLVLTKDNGTLLTTLPYTLGENNYLDPYQGKNLYTFTAQGLQAINTGTGEVRTVFSGNVSGFTAELDGKIQFLYHPSPLRLYRGTFDMATEAFTFSILPLPESDGVNASYQCLAIDARGMMLIGVNNTSAVRVYDRDNYLVKTISGWNTERSFSVTPAFREDGRVSYLTASWEGKGSTTYYNYTGLWGVDNDTHLSAYMSSSNGFRTDARYPMFSMQSGDLVYVQTGAMWAGLWGGGSVMSYYTEMAYLCTFNLTHGTASYGPQSTEFAFGAAGEYGRFAHSMIATTYSYNGDTTEIHPSTSMNGLIGKVRLRYQSLEEVLNRMVSRGSGDTHLFFPENPSQPEEYQNIADQVAEGQGTYQKAVSLKASGQPGTLQRTYQLNPNETYFYEYRVKGLPDEAQLPLSYEFTTTSREPEQDLLDRSYYVTRIEEEDFNDSQSNEFFTFSPSLMADGKWKGANLYSGKTSLPNRVFSSANTISFTVPEGEKALLSFEFDIGAKAWANSQITLNGIPWDRVPGITGKQGHYTGSGFLPEGENILQVSTVDYGTLPLAAWVYLDNLRVTFVKGSLGEEASSLPKTTREKDGFLHVKGTLKTPYPVMAYRGFPGENVYTDFHTIPDSRMLRDSSNNDYRLFTLTVPDEAIALDPRILIRSSPSYSSRNSWNVTWTWNQRGYQWICYGICQNGTVPYQIPREWRVHLGTLTGTQHIQEKARAYNGSWGDFMEGDFYQVERVPLAHEEGGYFYEGSPRDSGRTLFIENDYYNGETKLIFRVPEEGQIYLKDFQLYTMRDGKKVMAAELPAGPEDFLQKWEPHHLDTSTPVVSVEPVPEPSKLVYQKGERVDYQIHYLDYEEDPSRREYWRYMHQPFEDDLHPSHGKVLDQPIHRFYLDGKYQVQHWQEDNTSRLSTPLDEEGHPKGFPDYDLLSNVVSFTFYIEGGGEAPWITEILPAVWEESEVVLSSVAYGDRYGFRIGVDDVEKDDLSLTTEVYREGELLAVFLEEEIKAGSSGVYPKVWTPALPEFAKEGQYQVVCTVRDEWGTGLDTYSFQVEKVLPRLRLHRLY